MGHSDWYKALKVAEAQASVEKEMSQWNLENITQKTYEMENEEYNRRFDMEASEWERQFNLQNEYNSPTEQIKRMREAGINPAAQLGGSGLDPVDAASGSDINPNLNEVNAPFAQSPNLAQIKLANSQSDVNKQSAIQGSLKNAIDAATMLDEVMLRKGNVQLQHLQMNWQESETALNLQNVRGIQKQMALWEVEAEEMTKNIQVMDERIKVMNQEVINLQKQAGLYEAQTGYFGEQADFIRKKSWEQEIINKYVDKFQQLGIGKMAVEVTQIKNYGNYLQQKIAESVLYGNNLKLQVPILKNQNIYWKNMSQYMGFKAEYEYWNSNKEFLDYDLKLALHDKNKRNMIGIATLDANKIKFDLDWQPWNMKLQEAAKLSGYTNATVQNAINAYNTWTFNIPNQLLDIAGKGVGIATNLTGSGQLGGILSKMAKGGMQTPMLSSPTDPLMPGTLGPEGTWQYGF